MKWVFVLLLAANFAYLGWQLEKGDQQALSRSAAQAPLQPETGNLKLLSELNQLPPPRKTDQQDQTAATPSGAPTQPPAGEGEQQASASPPQPSPAQQNAEGPAPVPGTCFSIGPFDNKDDAEAFRSKQLADRVSTIEQRPDDDLMKKLFWVYLAPQTSEQMAREKLQELQRKGIKDYMLIQKGGLKNAISLGVFSSQDSVNRRLAELGDKGYQPVVVPRYEAQKVYWVDLKLGADEALPQAVSEALPSGVQSKPLACSKIALAPAQP